ncbi:MAG: bifunctional UDP-N-acetylglucosamine diphosphorylase/glucosamine-1-phosphate N-acetyltransferase GlmU [Thiotrichales bacterium]|nr:bifunctional UDP-N-acetylglucosamine diphosphorylase/glucosamine-1-phosphate N-acetyltransferase GlmU [Thiotrichales bacterium]
MTPLHVVILAAGQGRRMRSSLPKVLHLLAGRPLLSYVIEATNGLGAARVHVVHGYAGGVVREAMSGADVEWVEQSEQLGTGHALALAMPGIPDDATVLVLNGDVPLVNPTTLHETATLAGGTGMALVTAVVDEPRGYGRIVRDHDGYVRGIVEERDANEEQRNIAEIYAGILAAHGGKLRSWLQGMNRDNAQGEYLITDVIAHAVEDGLSVRTVPPETIVEVLGVNDRVQLAALERFHQRRLAEALMRDGASLADPARIDIRGRVRTGSDVFIDVNAVFEGDVQLGDRVSIGPGCVIKDTAIERDTEVRAHCVIEGAHVGVACRIGPFARLRPDTRMSRDARVGNFVEVKNATIGEGSKANHLTYIGDSRIGHDVNVGAGVVTCNYDGAHKHTTVIGDNAFIGSGVMLVAPVTVHAGATIGAGSTVGKDVPPDALALTRAPQRTFEGWKRPRKS